MASPALAAPLPAAQPQFHRLEGAADFLEGELTGLSVDSDGRVRLAPAVGLLHDTEAPFVWCLAADAKGAVFAGTGNDGKVFRIEGGKASVFFDAPELEVHALAVGRDGRLYVGTSPDGRVYAVDPAGQATTFFDPPEKYIWALAFDPAGNLLVATGAEGRVHRVDAKGASTTLLQTAETHVLSLAVDQKGTVYAGSAPSGILYRIDGAGKVFVVNDSTYREVKSLDLGPDGSVYAALVDARPAAPEESAPRAAAAPAATPVASVEVTVTEAFTGAVLPGASGTGTSPAAPGGPAKGALVRVGPGGEIDTLWSSTEDTPLAVLASPDGTLLATGGKGRLFLIRDDRSYSLVGILPSEQVTALARRGTAGTLVAVSGPGKVLSLEERPGERGTFVSKPRDTETVSTWGRLRVEAEVPAGTDLQVQTRSGNTESPDATWSDWSAALPGAGGPGDHQRARALPAGPGHVRGQGRQDARAGLGERGVPAAEPATPGAAGHGAPARRGLPEAHHGHRRPRSAGPGRATRGRPGLRRLDEGAAPARPAPRPSAGRCTSAGLQTFSWRGEDPNGDTLAYDVYFRATSETRFRLLRKGLTEAVLAWDTSTVPNGRYLVRVVASDAPSNPGRARPDGRPGERGLRRGQHAALRHRPARGRGAGTHPRHRPGRREPAAPGRVLRGRRPLGGDLPGGRHQRRARGELRVRTRRPDRLGTPRDRGARHRPPRQRGERPGRAALTRPPGPARRTLVVRAGALGDLLLLRPAVASLRAASFEVGLLAPSVGRLLLGDGPGEVQEHIDFDQPGLADPPGHDRRLRSPSPLSAIGCAATTPRSR